MRQPRRRDRVMCEINITPFTDVVLVLLIIFMVATPVLLQPGIKVELPKIRTAESDTDENLNITIGRGGEIYLEDKRIEIERLRYEITARLMATPNIAVMVKGDKDVKYDLFVKVVGAAKQSGAKRFCLGVEPKGSPPELHSHAPKTS
jgi:biopolymer transport protein ExbD